MATTFPTVVTASGSTDTFNIPWPYLLKSHVVVKLNGVTKVRGTHYDFLTAGQIQFSGGNVAAGVQVSIDRVTPYDPVVSFTSGPLSPDDMNTGVKQPLYRAEEDHDELDNRVDTLEANFAAHEAKWWETDLPGAIGPEYSGDTGPGKIFKGVANRLAKFDADGNIGPGSAESRFDDLESSITTLQSGLADAITDSWKTNGLGGYITKGSAGYYLQFDADGNIVPGLAVESVLAGGHITLVDTRPELKALGIPANGQLVYLKDLARFGFFRYTTANMAATLRPPSRAVATTSVDAGTNTFTKTSHGFTTSVAVWAGTAVNGLSTGTLYWVIRVDDNTFRLASSYNNAMAGVALDITGTTNLIFTPHIDPREGVYICPDADPSGASGVWRRLDADHLTPKMFGMLGDGVGYEDEGINCMMQFIRYSTIGQEDGFVRYIADLSGKYRTRYSIDATGIVAWNNIIRNGIIVGECAGETVFDLSGSRGYSMSNVLIYGKSGASRPHTGILCARTTHTAFCDLASFEDVSVIGHFSVACEIAYGQETAHRRHGRMWNYSPDGYCGVFQNYDTVPMVSKFRTLLTGLQSMLHNTYDNCDWRYLPVGNNIAVITGLATGATTSVTSAGHPFANGDEVVFWNVAGTYHINSKGGTVSNDAADSFDVNIDSSTFPAYAGGGYAVRKAEKPPVYFSLGSFNRFNNCYIAGYGDDSFVIDWPTTGDIRGNTFDFVLEGALVRSHFRFLVGTGSRILTECDFRIFNSFTGGSMFSTDASGGGLVRMYGGGASVSSHSFNLNRALMDTPSKYAFYSGFHLYYPNRAIADIASTAGFRGTFGASDGNTVLHEHGYAWAGNGAYTPTVEPSSGAFGAAVVVNSAQFRRFVGDLAYLNVDVSIPDNGTGSGSVRVYLPSGVTAAAEMQVLAGGAQAVSGKTLKARLTGGFGYLVVTNYDGTYPASSGERIVIGGVVRIAT